ICPSIERERDHMNMVPGAGRKHAPDAVDAAWTVDDDHVLDAWVGLCLYALDGPLQLRVSGGRGDYRNEIAGLVSRPPLERDAERILRLVKAQPPLDGPVEMLDRPMEVTGLQQQGTAAEQGIWLAGRELQGPPPVAQCCRQVAPESADLRE